MNEKCFIRLAAIVILFNIMTTACVQQKGTKLSLDSPDAIDIQNTIRLSYGIEAQVAHTYDDSLYPAVYVNDQRGGKITGSLLRLIREMRNDDSLTSADVGFLDYKLAMNQFSKEGTQISSQTGVTSSKGTNSTGDSSGKTLRPLIPPSALPTEYVFQYKLTFQSVTVGGDVAKANFTDGACKIEMTLVEINQSWYIAGEKEKCNP